MRKSSCPRVTALRLKHEKWRVVARSRDTYCDECSAGTGHAFVFAVARGVQITNED